MRLGSDNCKEAEAEAENEKVGFQRGQKKIGNNERSQESINLVDNTDKRPGFTENSLAGLLPK